MNNDFKNSLKVHLTKAETPNDILKGIDKVPKKSGTYKGSRLAKMPELMISDKEHEEIVNKTIGRVLEKLEKEPEF